MSGCFRQRVIAFFLERKPPNERLARNMLDWTHRGFSATTRSEFRPAPRKHARRSPSTSLGRQQLVDLREACAPRCRCRICSSTREAWTPWSIAHPTPTISTPTRRPFPTRLAAPTHSHLWPALLARPRHVVPQPSPPPPRSRGLEARPSTPAIRPHRSARRAAARAVGVGQAEPRRMARLIANLPGQSRRRHPLPGRCACTPRRPCCRSNESPHSSAPRNT